MLSQQAFDTHSRIQGIDRDLQRWHCSNGLSRRLATIPGIGPIGASALAASYQPS
jgi:transposase